MDVRDWFTEELVSRLVEKDFLVCVSTSSTGSKYVELDEGLGIRIRVSNHGVGAGTCADVSVQPRLGNYNDNVKCFIQLRRSTEAVSEVVRIACESREDVWKTLGYRKYKRFLSARGESIFLASDRLLSTYALYGKRVYERERNCRYAELKKRGFGESVQVFCAI